MRRSTVGARTQPPMLRPAAMLTGMGAVTPVGVGVPAFARALREGRSGVRLLPFADGRIKSSVAARCADFDPLGFMSAADVARVPRLVPMALAAAREAAAQARLPVGDGLDPEAARS